jgi:hypothetical protein
MGLFRVLLLLGFVVTYWWAIVAVLVVAVAGFAVWDVRMHRDAELERRRRAQAAIAARADQQHAWILAGDDRGVYGEYTI